MSNKLRKIFSDKKVNLGGNIQFKDSKSYKRFIEALQTVQNDGQMVEVEGVSSLIAKAKDGEMEYPFLEENELTKIYIGPSIENVTFELDTDYGKKIVLFKRRQTTSEVILETNINEVIYFKIVLVKNSYKITITYRSRPNCAKKVRDIVESYNIAIALLDTLFIDKNVKDPKSENSLILDMKEYFMRLESLFKKLYSLEQELQLSFNPTQINDSENDVRVIEELHILFVQKKAIRLNAKINDTESTGNKTELGALNPEVGSKIDLTFINDSEYTIYGQKFLFYKANLLSDAIIKEIKECEDGTIKVLYGDTDNQPMYISYTGFKTINEARLEMESIMEHKEKYANALTFDEHLM